ncbi:MAG: ABC transporter ATP-binding protein [Chloroflexi bacterium]|nr:ABC transporter ATP-binding protein [Chloroflexota bacterium]
MDEMAVRVEGVGKLYRIGELHHGAHRTLKEAVSERLLGRGRAALLAAEESRALWALRDVSFEVARGEALGIVGRNGSGKSTLLKILARVTHPTEGRAEFRGRVAALLEVGTGFHPELTGRENVFLNGAILGMSRGDIQRRFDEIVAFAEVERFLDTPVKHYSSGMYVRLAFSVAAHLEPDILIADEVLAVGDLGFIGKCTERMTAAVREGTTLIFVSHNPYLIRTLCSRAIYLDHGRIIDSGAAGAVVEHYLADVGGDPNAGAPPEAVLASES